MRKKARINSSWEAGTGSGKRNREVVLDGWQGFSWPVMLEKSLPGRKSSMRKGTNSAQGVWGGLLVVQGPEHSRWCWVGESQEVRLGRQLRATSHRTSQDFKGFKGFGKVWSTRSESKVMGSNVGDGSEGGRDWRLRTGQA